MTSHNHALAQHLTIQEALLPSHDTLRDDCERRAALEKNRRGRTKEAGCKAVELGWTRIIEQVGMQVIQVLS